MHKVEARKPSSVNPFPQRKRPLQPTPVQAAVADEAINPVVKRRRGSLLKGKIATTRPVRVQDNIQLVCLINSTTPFFFTLTCTQVPELRSTPLPIPPKVVEAIEEEVVRKISASNPLLKFFVKVKLVRNERRNFLNLRVQKQYVPLVHAFTAASGTIYFFFLSIHIEPQLQLVCIHPERGLLCTWACIDKEDFVAAVTSVKTRFGDKLSSEQYVTRLNVLSEGRLQDQLATSDLNSVVREKLSAEKDNNTKLSEALYFRINISTDLYARLMPILSILAPEQVNSIVLLTDHFLNENQSV